MLLFDEPLSNLDAKLRADMRIELQELQHRLGVTSVYVTHDLEEALAMSDRIVVMRDGVIEQAGTPTEIYDRPEFAFRCGIRWRQQHPAMRRGRPERRTDCRALRRRAIARAPDRHSRAAPASASVRSTCACHRAPIRRAQAATVISASYLGDLMQYELRSGDLAICARGLPNPELSPGATVFWSVAPESCFLVAA